VAVTTWSLFAFGGVYFWTTIPIVAGACVLALLAKPAIGTTQKALDFAILAPLGLAALALVPLPAGVRLALSPALSDVERRLYVDPSWSLRAHPLSLDPTETARSLALAAAAVLVFWSARRIVAERGVGRILRTVSACGLVAAITAVLQHATSPHLFYWLFPPMYGNAAPYTPFGNRNQLATWMIMAIPLTMGYAVARFESSRRSRGGRATVGAIDDVEVWLFGGACAMGATLVASLSRSGITAGVAATLVFVWLARTRLGSRGFGWLLVAVGAVVTAAVMYANTQALMTRLNDAVEHGIGGREAIWAVTRVMIGDFWRTGVGVGAFERAMSVYQPPHVFSFNHAHNEYLQIAAEGGVLVSTGVVVVAVIGALEILRLLAADRSPLFWARAGAASALAAVAIQSIWETGLRLPANAVLFAICSAVALHPIHTGR
jgi:O-antigen ligase